MRTLARNTVYFEILSNPIRYEILAFIEIGARSYSEIMSGISERIEDEIKSNKLNFHLKKMLDENILVKNDKLYSLSELGLKLLSLMFQFANEDDSLVVKGPFIEDNYDKDQLPKNAQPEKLPLIKRLDDLPPLISVFEYFEGKNFLYMEENYSITLPEPISITSNPKIWIKEFISNLLPLMSDEKANEWLLDRYLKLGYGTRGLQDYGLMDSSLSVPPLNELFVAMIELLTIRGKAGLYGKTGMGKSRIELYIASHWIRTYKTPVYYIQNPHLMNDTDFEKTIEIFSSHVMKDRKSPKYLIIIEDAHLSNEKQIEQIKKLISGASNKTYSILVSFTEIAVLQDRLNSDIVNIEKIEELRVELIPGEYQNVLNLQNHWKIVRPYFNEWIKWVAVDILFDYLPNTDLNIEKTNIYNSPWSFVVSLGFLKGALTKLQTSQNTFPVVLYFLFAQIYIMRGEKSISLIDLTRILTKSLETEKQEISGFPQNWELKLIDLLNSWTEPTNRLLPPFKYVQNPKTLNKETFISFYHIEWATEVCSYLESSNKHNLNIFSNLFRILFPVMFLVWQALDNNHLMISEWFTLFLRQRVRFEISSTGEILLSSVIFTLPQRKSLSNFKISEDMQKTLKQSELINWMFVKSIIYN